MSVVYSAKHHRDYDIFMTSYSSYIGKTFFVSVLLA